MRRHEARVVFDPSDRPEIYLARGATASGGMAWASINDRTLTVRSLWILDNGSYALQTYHRTASDDTMFLHFISDRDGQTIRMVTANLKKEE